MKRETNEQYETLVGVGECAGVMVDLVQILLNETWLTATLPVNVGF